jgi:hypothetical protein
VPARIRPAPELACLVAEGAQHYVELAERFRNELRRLE